MTDSDDELPPGWEERATVDGNIYYVNHITQTTQWIHPRSCKRKIVPTELPYGWSKIIGDDGMITYVEEFTNIHTYSDPRLAFSSEEKESNRLFHRYDGCTTALEVLHGLDLSGKIAIVTGANTGIGFETARSLVLHGCCVIFACRSKVNAENAVAKIKSRSNKKCEAMELDLSSLKSVKVFCDDFKKRYDKLDILVMNAGIFAVPYTLTEDSYESIFQVCHLGHFYLFNLLKCHIFAACSPRVVIVSSESHRFSDLTLDTIDESLYRPEVHKYWSLMAYNNAKLCNILFASELHRRFYLKGVNIFVVHPGNMIYSHISRYYWSYRVLFSVCSLFTKSLQQAASCSVFCSTSPTLNQISGIYLNNCQICAPSEKAKNSELSYKLWLLSENLLSKSIGK